MNNYIVLQDISQGEFGKVQKIQNKFTNKVLAVKIELISIGLLQYEAKIYNILSGLNYVPRIKSFKSDGINNYLFMDLMDYNLKYFKKVNYKENNEGYIIIIKKIIVELLKGIAENADIEYDLGDKLVTDDVPTPFALKRALADLEKGDMPQENMDKEELDMEEEPKGLMSRKQEMI